MQAVKEGKDEIASKLEAAYEKCERLRGSGSTGSCDTKSKDLREAQGDFIGACGAVGLPEGLRDCAKKMRECKNRKSSSGGTAIEKATALAKYCPHKSGPARERFTKELEQAKKDLKAAEDKIPGLTEKVTDGAGDGRKEMNATKEKQREEISRHNKALLEASQNRRKEEQRIYREMAQVAAQISQIDAQLIQADLQKTDAARKRDQQKVQVDLNCHANASATVSKIQAEALEQLKAGRYSRGGQNSILRNVGLSDRNSWQRMADRYYQYCLTSKTAIESKESANIVYKSMEDQSEAMKTTLRKSKELAQQQLNRLKDPNGACSQGASTAADGATSDSEMCAARNDAAKAVELENKEHQAKLESFKEEMDGMQQDQMTKSFGRQQALAQAQRDVNKNQSYIDQLQNFLDKTGDGPNTSEESKRIADNFGKWVSAAQAYDADCCSKTSKLTSGQNSACAKNAEELEAANYEAFYNSPANTEGPKAEPVETAADKVQVTTATGGARAPVTTPPARTAPSTTTPTAPATPATGTR